MTFGADLSVFGGFLCTLQALRNPGKISFLKGWFVCFFLRQRWVGVGWAFREEQVAFLKAFPGPGPCGHSSWCKWDLGRHLPPPFLAFLKFYFPSGQNGERLKILAWERNWVFLISVLRVHVSQVLTFRV